MMASVMGSSSGSDTFPVKNGTKQGCVMAPVLFAIHFSAMLQLAFRDTVEGLNSQFRMNGNLINAQSLKAKTKLRELSLKEFLFADDYALSPGSPSIS